MTYLGDWVEKVIERDNKCVICGTRQNLEVHHVFKVNNYDDAYLDINNGITLCKSCHDNYHDKFGANCSIKNLLSLKKDFVTNDYNKLYKKYHAIKIHQKNADKKINKLKKKNRLLRKRLHGG